MMRCRPRRCTPARSPRRARGLISGPSGSGKSDLALRLLDRGFTLVSDDQTIVRKDDGRVIASAPPTIHGKLEFAASASSRWIPSAMCRWHCSSS